MAVKIKPLGDRVLVHPMKEDEVRASGIIIPDTAKEKPVEGSVVAVGPGRTKDDGTILPIAVKVGDKVIYGKYAGTELKYDDESYLLLREDDLLGVIQ